MSKKSCAKHDIFASILFAICVGFVRQHAFSMALRFNLTISGIWAPRTHTHTLHTLQRRLRTFKSFCLQFFFSPATRWLLDAEHALDFISSAPQSEIVWIGDCFEWTKSLLKIKKKRRGKKFSWTKYKWASREHDLNSYVGEIRIHLFSWAFLFSAFLFAFCSSANRNKRRRRVVSPWLRGRFKKY